MNFSIKELCASDTAARLKIDNTPTKEVEKNLLALIDTCLQPMRDKYGSAIIVSSGYRCPMLNAAINGAKGSQHITGEAADVVGAWNTLQQLKMIAKAALAVAEYDQLILEHARGRYWLHVSHKRQGEQRKQLLIFEGSRYKLVNINEFNAYIDGLH